MVRAHTPEGDLIWINAFQVQAYTVTKTGNLALSRRPACSTKEEQFAVLPVSRESAPHEVL